MQTKDKTKEKAKMEAIAMLAKTFPPEFLDQFMSKGRQPMTGQEVELSDPYIFDSSTRFERVVEI